MATLSRAQLSGSTLNSKTIHNSKLRNCTLVHVTLHSSDVADSVLKHSIIHDCGINSSKLSDCKIYSDKFMLKCKFEGCELLPSHPTLSKLPLSLSKAWDGKTPSLIVALRGHKELYCQALEIFKKTNRFHLSDQGHLKLFMTMPEKVLLSIRAISITVSPINIPQRLLTSDLDRSLIGCKALTDLRVVLTTGEYSYGLKVLLSHWAARILLHCRILKKFALLSSYVDQPATLRLGRQVSEMCSLNGVRLKFATTIEKLSYKLGVDAKEVLILSANGSAKMWIWRAEDGKDLTWKND